MTEQEIIERIDRSIAEEFELDRGEMTPEKTLFQDLGLDSLDIVDLVVAMERKFKVKVRDDERIKSIRTLGDVYQFVLMLKNEGVTPAAQH